MSLGVQYSRSAVCSGVMRHAASQMRRFTDLADSESKLPRAVLSKCSSQCPERLSTRSISCVYSFFKLVQLLKSERITLFFNQG